MDIVLGVCSSLCVLYLVYAIVVLHYTQYYYLIMVCRNREGQLNLGLLGHGRVEDEKERKSKEMGNYREKQGLKRISHPSQLPFLIRLIRLLIQQVITSIPCLLKSIRQVISLISHIHSYSS